MSHNPYPGDPYTFANANTATAGGKVTGNCYSAAYSGKTSTTPTEGAWVALADAANRLGTSQAALRSAVRDGHLRARGTGRTQQVWLAETDVE